MKNELYYNLIGKNRKPLVVALERYLKATAEYQNAPSYSYKIGVFEVDRTGTVICPNTMTEEQVQDLKKYLSSCGFVATFEPMSFDILQQQYQQQSQNNTTKKPQNETADTCKQCCHMYFHAFDDDGCCTRCCCGCASDPYVADGAGTACFVNFCL